MPGSHKMNRSKVIAALRYPAAGGDFVWDGVDQDDRPMTAAQLQNALATVTKRGRPAGSSTKEQVALRIDRDVSATFRASGPGW